MYAKNPALDAAPSEVAKQYKAISEVGPYSEFILGNKHEPIINIVL